MKKKRNILTIISSLLGVFTLTSLFSCSIFFKSDKKSEVVKADVEDVSVVLSGSFENTLRNYAEDQSSLNMLENLDYRVSGIYNVVRTLSTNSVSYSLRIRISFETTSIQYGDIRISNLSYVQDNVDMTLDEFSIYCWGITYVSAGSNKYTANINMLSTSYNQGNTSMTYVGDDTSRQISLLNTSVTEVNRHLRLWSMVIGVYGGDIVSFPPTLSNYDIAYGDGYIDGTLNGYENGYNEGVNVGYSQGYQAGVDSQVSVIDGAYSSGYSQGFTDAESQDSVVTSIFSGILQVALVPVNFFLSIFNFEILGINLSAFIRAIFTVVLTIIVLKTVLGKGGGGSDN